MKPPEQRETGQEDLFRSRLDQIIDLKHPLAKLRRQMDWPFLEKTFGAVYTDVAGRPPLPTQLMAGLEILKYAYNLSDERLCEAWLENPYFQYFCGEEFFRHALPFDRSSMTRWRQRMGEEKLKALLQESLAVAVKTGALKPAQLTEIVADTTVQPKNVMFPTDAKLMNRARERLVRLAKKHGVALRQTYSRVGKFALIKHQRYAHAKQFKRAGKSLRKLKTYLRRTIRDIARKIAGDKLLKPVFAKPLSLSYRVLTQKKRIRCGGITFKIGFFRARVWAEAGTEDERLCKVTGIGTVSYGRTATGGSRRSRGSGGAGNGAMKRRRGSFRRALLRAPTSPLWRGVMA